jgi:type II secretory pathway pseudopilin PulG
MMSAMPTSRRRKQAGYTLLLVVFLVASMIILAAAAAPSILTQGRREKEAELVWRGQQYARAIGLYYRKFGKYPTKVEDLTRQTNGVRFLRQAYTDPMNKEDGSWRFIYVGPNGQLIGSLHQTSLLQTTLTGASTFGGGFQPPPPPGTTTNQQPGTGGPGGQTSPAMAGNPMESQPQPLGGAVIGGNIIGVGSKIKKPSFRLYLGGDTYEQWEFIWNPTGVSVVNPNNTPGAPGVPNQNINPTVAPNGNNPNSPDGQQPPQNPQTPIVTVPPPAQ